jgi:Spy/CpxP family protein refolding chaperone
MMYDRDDRDGRDDGGGWRCQAGPYYGFWMENLTQEQKDKLGKLDDAFFKKIVPLTNEMRLKGLEMEIALNADKPDEAKVMDLHKQMTALKEQIDRARIDHMLQVRKVAPEARFGPSTGRGFYDGGWGWRGCGGRM